jgi:UDP-N-acetyl-2-amino-2-deoxyglucuronate dehydrogenase
MYKSGGIATNIGIHFFDMLAWIFGPVQSNTVHAMNSHYAAGYLELQQARVRWFLSINERHIPARAEGKRTFRSMTLEGTEIEFSDGFTDLHTSSYSEIISGNGFGLEEARQSIQIVHDIRNKPITPKQGDYHPLLKEIK